MCVFVGSRKTQQKANLLAPYFSVGCLDAWGRGQGRGRGRGRGRVGVVSSPDTVFSKEGERLSGHTSCMVQDLIGPLQIPQLFYQGTTCWVRTRVT